jgi:hypothetical protein
VINVERHAADRELVAEPAVEVAGVERGSRQVRRGHGNRHAITFCTGDAGDLRETRRSARSSSWRHNA